MCVKLLLHAVMMQLTVTTLRLHMVQEKEEQEYNDTRSLLSAVMDEGLEVPLDNVEEVCQTFTDATS